MFEITTEALVKTFIFVAMYSIAYQVSIKMIREKGLAIIIGFVVATLATVYTSVPQAIFEANTLGTTGYILLFLLPSLIAFLFIYFSEINSLLRKMFWVFYAIILISLLNNMANLPSQTITSLILAIVVLLVIILFLDTPIKNKVTAMKHLRKRRV